MLLFVMCSQENSFWKVRANMIHKKKSMHGVGVYICVCNIYTFIKISEDTAPS